MAKFCFDTSIVIFSFSVLVGSSLRFTSSLPLKTD
jgi:hypothetical protein